MSNNLTKSALILLWLIASAGAQEVSPQAQAIATLYESLQFEDAIREGRSLLRSEATLTSRDYALIHEYMALSFFTLGRQDSARRHFVSLLELNPDYQLDSIRTSPKIISFFQQIREQYAASETRDKLVPAVKYIFIEDPRPGAAWRSALLPGWGQAYKNQRTRAKWFRAGFLAGGVLTIGAAVLEKRYHKKYLDSTSQPQIDANYRTYNRWYKTRQAMTYLTASIWLGAVMDALWAPVQDPRLSVSISPTRGFALRIAF